ncbi:MAG TPA: DUF456 domain-containing protein [Thermoleophilia bacterium]|nr:DUF456 domain-containing protein [Thermoleophilia bacterium]
MDTDILVTVVAGLLLAAAVVGTVYPVLPGSPLAIGTLLVWGWVLGSTASWTAAATGALLAAAGWAASAVLTGRTLKRQQVPGRSIVVAMAAGIVGLFVIPFFGLFIGFAAGLLLSELARRRDLRAALDSSLESLKAMGLGILIEFGMVCLAASVWTIGVATHFATR